MSAPVVVLIVYAETLFEPAFVTYANCPVGSNVMADGMAAAAKGLPAMAVSAPVVVSTL